MALPTLKKNATADDVRAYIRQCVDLKFGTLTAYANKEKVSLTYISNVLSGNRAIPDWMLKRFKIVHTVVESWSVQR